MSKSAQSGVASLRLLAGVVAAIALPLLAFAAAPGWWSQRAVLEPAATPNDYALANQGQLKNVAKAAVAELEARLPGGAGDVLHNLIATWSTPGAQTNDYVPLNVGQLKNVAKPFYDRLIAVRYTDEYPWAGNANPPADFALANIGQIKNLFRFDLLATDPARDTDQDGLPDWWEKYYFGNPGVDPNAPAARGDGRTNLQAFQGGLNPLDYYNGQRPVLTVVSGNNQQSAPGSFLPLPLVVKVTGAANEPLANAPVTFAVNSGGGALAADPSSATAPSLQLRTAADGTASAFYQQPNAPAITSRVTASAGPPAARSEAAFTAVTQESQLPNTLSVTPDQIDTVVNAGQSSTIPVTLTNGTAQPLQFAATVENGTFRGNYRYRDSDQAGGPAFVWNDISTTGTRLEDISDADDDYESFDISFPFPYFNETSQTVFVSSNGYITFGDGASDYSTYAFPSSNLPANEIAPFHNDLNPGNTGDIYYLEEADRVVIQFENVARYARDGFATFQIVLQRDGTILFYYKEMIGTTDKAAVGLQNSTQEVGLTVAFNQLYLKNNLAVQINNSVTWLSLTPPSGNLAFGESATLELLLDAQAMESGAYSGLVQITAGASPELALEVPVAMTINAGPQVQVTAPSEIRPFLQGSDLIVGASAEDADGVSKVEFYDGLSKLGESSRAPFTFSWQNLPFGLRAVRARAIDSRGAVRTSAAVVIDVQADSNQNGMGDAWELQNFGNLNQTGEGDYDGDGLNDRAEFAFNTSPITGDSDGDGASDGDEVNVYHTNPHAEDTDGDGMNDGYETRYGLDPFQDDTQADLDGDGLSNQEEMALGTKANNSDSDSDGLPDGEDGWALDGDITLPRSPERQYAVIGLGPMSPADVNNRGQVVGGKYSWENGALRVLEPLSPGTLRGHSARAVNDNGIICGFSGYRFNDGGIVPRSYLLAHACTWGPNSSQPTSLGDLTRDNALNDETPWPTSSDHDHGYATPNVTNHGVSSAQDINRNGTIAGQSHTYIDAHTRVPMQQSAEVEAFDVRACVFPEQNLGTLLGSGKLQRMFPNDPWSFVSSGANALNDQGTIVGGSSFIVNGQPGGHAFKSDGGTMTDLGSLGGGSTATAISNTGHIVGGCGFYVSNAFIVSPGKPMRPLSPSTSGTPKGINTSGVIVGGDPALIWQNGRASSLNDRIAASGAYLTSANAISDSGLIACTGFALDRPDTGFLLLPVELVEVTPALKDETGAEIPNSTKPKYLPQINDLVEEPRTGQTPNVAYRVLKVKVPKEMMAGEKVKWSMTPQFTPQGATEPRFRGVWPAAPHADRFEAAPGNAYGFQRISQAEGRTTVDAEGFFAVRINLPPIGFNKARVKLEFEKYPGALVQVDFQVPAIVVIDPGHGGTGRITDPDGGYSDGEHAVGPLSHVQEKAMALTYGLALRDALKTAASNQRLSIKVFMTRETDVNFGPRFRTNKARDNGADILLSIHFNAFNATARGVGNLDSAAYGKCKL